MDTWFRTLHGDLHRIAHHLMRRERIDHTLETNAIISQFYLRVCGQPLVADARFSGSPLSRLCSWGASCGFVVRNGAVRRARPGLRESLAFGMPPAFGDFCPMLSRSGPRRGTRRGGWTGGYPMQTTCFNAGRSTSEHWRHSTDRRRRQVRASRFPNMWPG